jgi:hypothetical protein
MTAETELAPKVATVRRLTRRRYGDYLRSMGLKLDGDSVVWDEENMALSMNPDLHEEQLRWDDCRDNLDQLVHRIEKFYPLDPLDLTIAAGVLGPMPVDGDVVANTASTNVLGRLQYANAEWMSSVDGLTTNFLWQGSAANQFVTGFLNPFGVASGQQQAYGVELHIALQAYHDTMTRAVADMNQILDSCIDALDGAEGGSMSVLTTIGIVTGVVSLVFTGPVSAGATIVGLGATLVSEIAAHAQSGAGSEVEFDIRGPNAPMIITATWDAVTGLEKLVADVDDQLQAGLDADLASTSSFASPGLRLDRPDVADFDPAKDPTAFHLPPPGDLGAVAPADNWVVATLSALHTAGTVNLPGAAAEYASAQALLDRCTLPGYLTWFFQRSMLPYEEARLRLAGILGSISDSLTDAGATLVQIAAEYDLGDAESAEFLNRIEGLSPPPERTVVAQRAGMPN